MELSTRNRDSTATDTPNQTKAQKGTCLPGYLVSLCLLVTIFAFVTIGIIFLLFFITTTTTINNDPHFSSENLLCTSPGCINASNRLCVLGQCADG